MPTRNLLEALRRARGGLLRFVLVSSLASCSPSRPDRPHREDDPRRPIEFYGQSNESGHIVPLFNPRREAWKDHFLLDGLEIVGLTPTGRATARVLGMNTPTRIELRAALRARVDRT
jgi:hypothetical protein